ncbi:unnamed protein product, partial [Rotaria sp. Silwood1]
MSLSLVFFYVIFHVSVSGANKINTNYRPSIGVIRWDAWNLVNGQYDAISFYLHRALSPEKFHYRIPFYASVLSPTNISFNGDLQSVMD